MSDIQGSNVSCTFFITVQGETQPIRIPLQVVGNAVLASDRLGFDYTYDENNVAPQNVIVRQQVCRFAGSLRTQLAFLMILFWPLVAFIHVKFVGKHGL